ncbi:MAG TPA: GAF domain-containing protein [Planctomycetes bacterium]|nr:GAF domain-containing protein [Planctomycetota bacterium]
MKGIDVEALCEIFPFNFKIGEDMTLIDVSPRLFAKAPQITVGAKLLDCVEFERPILKKYNYETLLNYKKSALEIKISGVPNINFVGQIVQNRDSLQEIIFLIKPFATDLDMLTEIGFSLSDFAPSDALPDLLLGIQFAESKNVQLKQQNELLSEEMVVNKFLSDIFVCDTLETLFLNIAVSTAKALQADDVVIYRVESSLARQVAGAGSTQTSVQVSETGLAIPSGKGVVGRAVSEQKSQLVPDVNQCDYYIRDLASKGGSEIAVPVLVDGQVIAVIDSESKETDRYSIEDQHLLETFAELAGPMIINHIRRIRVQEESLKTAQKLRNKNRSLKSISHEFRTPLAQISSGVQLIAKHGDEMGEDEKRDTLESLLNPINRLTSLFESLMSEESGVKEAIIMEEFCLIALINRIAKQALRPYGRDGDLIITSKEKSLIVNSSRESMTQIILNLLVNAAKYSVINTEINLSIENFGHRFLLSVADCGIGIKGDDLGSVFEPHMRSAEAIVMAEGAGFGLSIVRNKVEELGGEVSVTSTKGIGSCFKVSIPSTA